jgi:hypothetical protein
MISKEAADRDYFNIWTSGGISSPLDPDQLDAIRESQRTKFYAEVNPNPSARYLTKWYVPPKDREEILHEGNVVLGVDTSDAQGRDDIALQYVDLTSLEVLGTSYINKTNLIEFGLYLYGQLMRYPKLTMIMERKSSGVAIMDQMIRLFQSNGQNAFRRMFNRIVQEADKYKNLYDDIRTGNKFVLQDLYATQKSVFGFTTAAIGEYSRSLLYSQVFQNTVRHSMDRIHDIKTIDQIMALEVKNDRVNHPAGGHDDGVIAWLLPNWLAQFGNNLHFYGIDVSSLMTNTLVSKHLNEQSVEDFEQIRLRAELDDLLAKLKGMRDPLLIHRLTGEIKNVTTRIVAKEDETFSMTEMIKNVRENRRTTRNGPTGSGLAKQLGMETVQDTFKLLY